MRGAELRMRRLFGKESGRAYVVAIDHGMLFGVQEGSEDAVRAVERSVATGPDGLFISPGLLGRTGHLLAHGGHPRRSSASTTSPSTSAPGTTATTTGCSAHRRVQPRWARTRR
jgi:DhnA family fructose-bisphosphate aldolase class Ia